MALNAVALSARIYPTIARTLLSHYARRLTHRSRRLRSNEPGDVARVRSHHSGSSSSSSPRPKRLFRPRSHDHGKRRRKRRSHAPGGSDLADEQVLYDLSLAIARMFVKSMCRDTVESIQHFADMPLPVPPHVRAQVTQVPPAAIHKAAVVLTDFFTGVPGDREEFDPLVGGRRWWQVRPGPLEGEWLVPARTVRRHAAEKGTRKRDRFRNMFRSTPFVANSRTSLTSSLVPPVSSPAAQGVRSNPPSGTAAGSSLAASEQGTGSPAQPHADNRACPSPPPQRPYLSAHTHAQEPPGIKLGQFVRGARRSMSTFRHASKRSTHATAVGSDAEHTDRTPPLAGTSPAGSPAVTEMPLSPVLGDAGLTREPDDASDAGQGERRRSSARDHRSAHEVHQLLHILSGHGPLHGPESDPGERRGERENISDAESYSSDSEDEGEMVNSTDQDPFDIEPRRLNRIMLYCHGGAYYFGSNDTHRMMVARYARDIDGAAFSVTYRLAPQYPFPCGLHDLLAAYLYLISPAPDTGNDLAGGQSSPIDSRGTRWGLGVDPGKIILSGDSAGGGMVLALLQVLRDMGQPLPAGAALISPWSDLTHSFPSIMPNLQKDYIPDHGFIHKPSPLWPAPKDTDVPATAPAHDSGHCQLFKPRSRSKEEGKRPVDNCPLGHSVMTSALMKEDAQAQHRTSHAPADEAREAHPSAPVAKELDNEATLTPPCPQETKTSAGSGEDTSSPLPSPISIKQAIADSFGPRSHLHDPVITVNMDSSKKKGRGHVIKIQEQIQLYATNGQLVHPLVSPACAGSLGGLPPLYILAGNNEALRDEIIWVAHRAAHPDKYPCPPHLVKRGGTTVASQQRFDSQPTPVHLQVWDDGVHVMPAFVFTYPAHLMYHGIASFCKAVTGAPVEHTPRTDETDKWVPEDPPDGTGNPDYGPGRHKFAYSKREPLERPHLQDHMIRERVSVHGIVRPMEPEHLMSALTMPREHVGVIQPGPAGLFHDVHREWEHKFKREPKRIANLREGVRVQARAALNLAKADEDVVRGVEAALPPPFQLGKAHHHHHHHHHHTKLRRTSPMATKPALNTHPVADAHSGANLVVPESPRETNDKNSTSAPSPVSLSPLESRHDKPSETRHHGFSIAGHGHIKFTPLDLVGETPPPTALAGRIDTVEALKLLRMGIEEVRRRGQALRDN